jgi:hypothetical protein
LLPDGLAALLKVGEGFDAEVAEQLPVAAVELLVHPLWRIGGEHLLALGIGHDHSEHILTVEPPPDQLAAAVDRNRAGRVVDICTPNGGVSEWAAHEQRGRGRRAQGRHHLRR